MAKAHENTGENAHKSPEKLQKEVISLKGLLQESYLEIQRLKERLHKYETRAMGTTNAGQWLQNLSFWSPKPVNHYAR